MHLPELVSLTTIREAPPGVQAAAQTYAQTNEQPNAQNHQRTHPEVITAMSTLELADWLIIFGFAGIWLGTQIVANGRLPRQLRRGPVPSAAKGSPEAFGLFWIDQYGYIGLTLAIGGAIAVILGVMS